MLPEFNNIKFKPSNHTYLMDNLPKKSVSKMISNLYEPFNSRFIAPRYAKKHGLTTDQVLNAWNTQNAKETNEGSRVHDFAEMYVTQRYIYKYPISSCDQPQSSQDMGVISWWHEVGSKYPILDLEAIVGTFWYCGTFDVLLGTKDDCKIVDYKTNKALFKDSYGRTLKAPFDDFKDEPFSKYVIQQNLYKIALESKGYNSSKMIIVWLRKDDDGKLYQQFEVPDITDRLKGYLKTLT